MKLLLMNLPFHLTITPVNFSADIVPSATPADQPIVPSASASQRREIALKQVSYPISISIITST
jgi:hypothetical protein